MLTSSKTLSLHFQMGSSSSIFVLVFFFLTSLLPIHTSTHVTESLLDPWSCVPFTCGNFSNIGYPFWFDGIPPYCGHPAFKLDCSFSPPSATFNISYLSYLVLDMNRESQILTIARTDIASEQGICNNSGQTVVNTNLDDILPSFYSLTSTDENATLFYNCTQTTTQTTPQFPNDYTCLSGAVPTEAYLVSPSTMDLPNREQTSGCRGRVSIPILTEAARDLIQYGPEGVHTLIDVLRKGFEVKWEADMDKCVECRNYGGVCGYNNSNNTPSSVVDGNFICFCNPNSCHVPPPAPGTAPWILVFIPAPPPPWTGKRLNGKNKAIIAVASVVGGVLLISLACIIYRRRKRRTYASSYASRSLSSYPSSRSDLERGSRNLGVHLFTYAELVDATKNFDEREELGDGGFGTVYYGKLKDGREVAVKRLYENNYKRVEQFMNEVAILTDLHHKNLVTLYGCTSRHSRELLLVYEYIENGTVADHLHGAKARPGSVPWSLRLKIAVETASALMYLHASGIIHRDVKTNNILLDKNFNVKVADFGLSRLFPMDVTHISTAPQGTPGYVDPEYHQCYQLTEKSDVYSFGVVLAELISSLPAVDITRHRHEINLSNMAINSIQSHALHEFVDSSLGYATDETVRQSISTVAELTFQCLQGAKELRPTMDEVLDTLTTLREGKSNLDRSLDDEDTTPDDVGLLKCTVLPLSPVSVTANWSSSSGTITPNTSS